MTGYFLPAPTRATCLSQMDSKSDVGRQRMAATLPDVSDERAFIVQSHVAREKHLHVDMAWYPPFAYVFTGELYRELAENDAIKPACHGSVPCEPNPG